MTEKKLDLNAQLCYVDGNWAYFTTQKLSEQWGDDWNDAPYEHNAGTPYKWYEGCGKPPYEIVVVAYNGPLVTPCEYFVNSPFSVENINAGVVAWLCTDMYTGGSKVIIAAGITICDFIVSVYKAGGAVYTEVGVREE